MIVCENCKQEVDYLKEIEVCMGAILCPHCNVIINQDGTILEDRSELEKLCKRCGMCCHSKVKINNEVCIFLNNPCTHLTYEEDEKGYTRAKCLVYEKRFNREEIGIICIPIDIAIKKGILPEGCGYLKIVPKNYIPAKVVSKLTDISL